MKQLLAFALLVGAGLFVLYWLEPEAPEPQLPDEPPGRDELPPIDAAGDASSVDSGTEAPNSPGVAQGKGDERPLGMTISGTTGSTFFDTETGRARVVFRSTDSRTVRTGATAYDEAHDVRIEIRDPSDDANAVQVTLFAKLARITREGETDEFRPIFRRVMELEDVVVKVPELPDGTPLAPLELALPTAVLDFREEEPMLLTSPDVVVLTSDAALIEGTGFTYRIEEDIFDFARHSSIEFVDERTGLSLACAGKLSVFRDADEGASSIAIDAQDEAQLVYTGERAWTIDADRVRILGRESGAGDERRLRLRRLGFTGNVISRSAESEFRSQRGRVLFGPEGRPLTAEFEGLPSALLTVSPEASLPGTAPGEVSHVRVDGEGPLTVTWGEPIRFAMKGASTIESAGSTLRAAGGAEGWLRSDDTAGFRAQGGVVLEIEGAVVETAEIEVEVAGAKSEATSQRVTTRGGTRILGTLDDGRAFTLSSPDRIEVLRTIETWEIVEAIGVVLTVEGADGFEARADRVTHFEPNTPKVHAEGNVSLIAPEGTGSGQSLEVQGRDRFVLAGKEGAPARFEGAAGRAEALHVERNGDRLEARGDVHAWLSPSDTSAAVYDIRCEELGVERREERRDDVLEAWYDFTADGGVIGQIQGKRETSDFRCRSVVGTRVESSRGEGAQREIIGATTSFVANELEQGRIVLPDVELELTANKLELDRSEGGPDQDAYTARASGKVEFSLLKHAESELEPPIRLRGLGEQLTVDHTQSARLLPAPGKRVTVRGELPSHRVPFEVHADSFELIEGNTIAGDRPQIYVARLDLPEGESANTLNGMGATAAHFRADADSLHLSGGVRVSTGTRSGVPWSFQAQRVDFEASSDGKQTPELRGVYATGGVSFELGARDRPLDEVVIARASGETLVANSILEPMRLSGLPARIESDVFVSEAEWLEFDPDLQIVVATGRGRMFPSPASLQPGDKGWRLEYNSSRTFNDPDSLIYVLQEPVFDEYESDSSLRSSWAIFWLDRHRWLEMPGMLAEPEAPADVLSREPSSSAPVPSEDDIGVTARLFGLFQRTAFGDLLRETYFEGPVEVHHEGSLLARTDAIYLDVVAGHGWLANATVNLYGHMVGQDFDKLIIKADWLRHSADNSLHASDATVTPCSYDEPHIKIVTGDLKLTPQKKNYSVSLRNNRVELYDKLRLPLPPISWSSDEKGRPIWESVKAGDSARFGSFVSAGIVRPAGGLGKAMNSLFGGNPFDYDAHYSVDASYLGSRGVLLDLGVEIESKDDYWFEMQVGGVPDSGEDRGYVRVEEDEREKLRTWTRGIGRWTVSEEHWIDVAGSYQSDAGVQSEFYENDFERYERSETYVHWRKARGSNYISATIKPRVENFRSDIEELPSVDAFRGRAPILDLGPLQLVHDGRLDVEALRRREGDAGLQSPFGHPATFGDGLGDREVFRIDTQQTLELPFALGFGGLRATPWIGARLTAWDEAAFTDRTPLRFVSEAGLRVATTFWKRAANGAVHQISPFVGYRTDLETHEEGGRPVRFDDTEDSPEGQFLDLGARARFEVGKEHESALDLQLRGSYGTDLPDGREDGWLPLEVFAHLDTELFQTPVELWHDGRYDLETSDTSYALTSMAVRFTDDLRIEAGHRKGDTLIPSRDDPSVIEPTSYEAATIAAIYRWTEKWEFEGEQTFSLTDNDSLDSAGILRRYGHDLVFEIEVSVREGEGGSSFSVNVKPLFGWKPSRIGFLGY